ncbi:MAG: Fmu (Sun) domain-containing protein [Thermoproteota archaeon]|nr:Fmu (Sun) domain-containing protein [Thermoproteota archaeon]
MAYFKSYLYTAVRIIEAHKGEVPLATFLKNYFAENKKYGAKDRKQISSLCYYYFRLGNAAITLPIIDRIVLGVFLCETEPSDFMSTIKPEWNKKMNQSLKKKLSLVKNEFNINDVFPLTSELSETIDPEEFSQSLLMQPDLFLRVRPRVRLGILTKLKKTKLAFRLIDDDCIALPNSTKVDDYFTTDKEVVIQDYNSQKVLDFLKPQYATLKTPCITAWDCCAASGGKSILLFDIFNQRVDLTISDIRPKIILNLSHRFLRTGIKAYNYFIADLTSDQFENSLPLEQRTKLKPKIIICDVPCTGSGTWGRTPEQLHFFNPEKIIEYSSKQKKIVANAIPYLQEDGLFIYITCSVFKKENEEVADFIKEKFDLLLIEKKILKGYDKKADNMFVAVFKKNP